MSALDRFYQPDPSLDLIDRVRRPIVRNIVKHELQGYDDPEREADRQINGMSNVELLEAISNAMERRAEHIAQRLVARINEVRNAAATRDRAAGWAGLDEARVQRGREVYEKAIAKLKELFL